MTKDKRRYINTTIWNKSWFRKLNSDSQLLYIFLLTCPLSSLSGVFEISDELIEFYINIKPKEAIKELAEAGEVARFGDWIVIVRHPDFQKWETSPKIAMGLFSELTEIPKEVFLSLWKVGYTYPPIVSNEKWGAEYARLLQLKMNENGFEYPPYSLASVGEVSNDTV